MNQIALKLLQHHNKIQHGNNFLVHHFALINDPGFGIITRSIRTQTVFVTFVEEATTEEAALRISVITWKLTESFHQPM